MYEIIFCKGTISANHSLPKVLQNVRLNYYNGSVCEKETLGSFSNETQICAGW